MTSLSRFSTKLKVAYSCVPRERHVCDIHCKNHYHGNMHDSDTYGMEMGKGDLVSAGECNTLGVMRANMKHKIYTCALSMH